MKYNNDNINVTIKVGRYNIADRIKITVQVKLSVFNVVGPYLMKWKYT